MKRRIFLALSAIGLLTTASGAAAEQRLSAYATMPEKYASEVFAEFTRDTGVPVDYLRLSAGEVLARLQLEKTNPNVDVVLGGPADIYTAGLADGLFAAYKPSGWEAIPASLKDPDGYWTGIGVMPLCFVTNRDFLDKNGLKAPASWLDLLDERYKNGLMMGDARTSGTATERIFSIIKAFGEDGGFDYQKKLHRNVQMYSKSGAWPAMRVGEGTCASGIVFLPDALDIQQIGYPVDISYPKEGVTAGIEASAIVAGAKNRAAAEKFLEWVASPKFAQFIVKNKINYIPSRVDVKSDNPALDIQNVKLLEASTEWKGKMRKAYTERWINEVIAARP